MDLGRPCNETKRQPVDHEGNRVATERWDQKKGKAANSMEGRNTKVRRQRMDSSSARQERVEVHGRGLRPAVDLNRLVMMMMMMMMMMIPTSRKNGT